MKHLLTLLMTLVTLAAAGQSPKPGIQFFKGSYRKALTEAQKTGKLIFVDVYTTWCGPCKRMEKEIFPLREVGDKYNALFVNLQLDAEGNGRRVAEEFNVRSYPTYLWIDGNGNLVHRAVGYHPKPAPFLAHADVAVRNADKAMSNAARAAEFEQKKNDKTFLREYTARARQLGDAAGITAAADQYLRLLGEQELQQPEHATFLLQYLNNARSQVFRYVLDHQAFFASEAVMTKEVAPEIVRASRENKLAVILSNEVIGAMIENMGSGNDSLFTALDGLNQRIENKTATQPLIYRAFQIQFWKASGNKDTYRQRAVPFLDSLAELQPAALARMDSMYQADLFVPGKDMSKLGKGWSVQAGRILAGNAEMYVTLFPGEPAVLDKAIYWAEQTLRLDPGQSRTYDVLTKLYLKAARNEDARKAIHAAMELVSAQDKSEGALNAYRKKLESIP